MKNKTLYIASLFTLIGGIFMGLILSVGFTNQMREILLSPDYYYDLPNGGYIYIDGEYIRYNFDEFNGELDYQITLNYEAVK